MPYAMKYERPKINVFQRVVESRGRRVFVLFALLFVFFLFAVKVYYDTNSIEVRHYEIAGSSLGEVLEGTKVAFVSDLHIERLGSREIKLLEIINKEEPDLLLIGGDLISFKGPYAPVLSFFSLIKAPLWIYSVLGNTEYSNENGSCILCHEDRGLELKKTRAPAVLRNSFVAINVHGKNLNLFGVDDPVQGRGRLELAMENAPRETPSILLAHSPVIFEEASNRGVDLVLCGHNHGGQLFFTKFLRKIFPLDPGLEFLEGFFQKGSSLLYVGKGVGTSYLPFRLGVKPEIAFFSFVNPQPPSRTAVSMSVKNSTPETVFGGLSFASLAQTFGFFDLYKTLLPSARHLQRDQPPNVLFDFESEAELQQLNWECHKWFELSEQNPTSGLHSLRLSLPPGSYPGIEFKEVRENWSPFKLLKMDVTNPSTEDIKFHVRIDDREGGWEYANRFDIDFTLKPGLNNISIATDSIKTNLHARSLDLKNIKRMMVFIPDNQKRSDLFLDNIRLE
jgi:predicted MPP superfamily phosphohydrolase